MNTTDLIWGENHLTLVGEIILSPNDTFLDLTLTADAIDWNQVNKIVDYVEKKVKIRAADPQKELYAELSRFRRITSTMKAFPSTP